MNTTHRAKRAILGALAALALIVPASLYTAAPASAHPCGASRCNMIWNYNGKDRGIGIINYWNDGRWTLYLRDGQTTTGTLLQPDVDGFFVGPNYKVHLLQSNDPVHAGWGEYGWVYGGRGVAGVNFLTDYWLYNLVDAIEPY